MHEYMYEYMYEYVYEYRGSNTRSEVDDPGNATLSWKQIGKQFDDFFSSSSIAKYQKHLCACECECLCVCMCDHACMYVCMYVYLFVCASVPSSARA